MSTSPTVSGGSRTFPSKCDTWLAAILAVTCLAMLIGAGVALLQAGSLGEGLLIAMLMLASGGFVLWVWRTTDYTLDGGALVVRSGPLRWRVPLESIEAIEPTRNPLSNPALSLDRLELRTSGRHSGLLISPQDKAGFLAELVRRSGGRLRLEGERAVRSA